MGAVLNRAAELLAIIAGLVLSAVVVLVFVDVILRYFFDAPWGGRQDLVEMGMVVSILLAAPYAWRASDHISVDLLPNLPFRWLECARAWFVNLAVAGIYGLIAWRAWFAAEDAMLFNEATNMIAIPHRPFILLIMIIAALHAAMIVVECLAPGDSGNDRSDEEE